MNRRELLRYTALMTGGAVAAPLASFLLSGCRLDGAEKIIPYKPFFFSDIQYDFVKRLADAILPKTDSPAASEVGVPQMIDHMTGTVYGAETKEFYQKGFALLEEYFKDKTDINAELEKMESAADAAPAGVADAYFAFKQQTVAFYLSTEEIKKNHLNYLPVPGAYVGCADMSISDGKAWAS